MTLALSYVSDPARKETIGADLGNERDLKIHRASHPPRRALLAAAAALCTPRRARAQAGGAEWPIRAVRYINAYPAGGPTDKLSRVWCAKMTEITGQSF